MSSGKQNSEEPRPYKKNKLKHKIYTSLYKTLQGRKQKTRKSLKESFRKKGGAGHIEDRPKKDKISDNYFELTHNGIKGNVSFMKNKRMT